MYDLIGDIHSDADELAQLLETLGYNKAQGAHRHPERRVIFLGEFIDRGPKIRQVLEIVRPMIEEGMALAVMGNHEFNALAFHPDDPEAPGEFLRRHSPKNENQHRKTVEQLRPDELKHYLNWYRTLPLWLELDSLRVVHACWDERQVKEIALALEVYGGITTGFLQLACKEGESLFEPVETVLKGKEVPLPAGLTIRDKDGAVRTEIRTRWYLPPEGHTYRTYALQSDEVTCDLPLATSVVEEAVPYPCDGETGIRPGIIGSPANRPAGSGRQCGLSRLQRGERWVPLRRITAGRANKR